MGVGSRPPLLGIRHVALRVPDLGAAERFWVEVLGFRIEWRPDSDNVYLTSGSDNLALHAETKGAPRTAGGALDHVGLLVAAADHVDLWAQHLERHGVPLTTEAKTHRDGARSIYFRDPAGNLVQILYHPPISDRGDP